jgi:hypothetical protein
MIKRSIDDFFRSASNPSKVSCVGYTMGPTVLKSDPSLAMRRGQEVCRYMKAKNPGVELLFVKATNTRIASETYRRVRIAIAE